MTISISPHGRWNGRVTSRPLPDASDELAELDPSLRRVLGESWWTQCATEFRVATSFSIVHQSLAALDAEPSLVALAERAIDDEHRHAALCLDMAHRYFGSDIAPPPPLPPRHPQHREAKDEDERRALFVIGQCALNETFANAYLSTAYRDTKSPIARAAINELMRDEIDHSRLGWAFLATLPVAKRERISDWLVPLAITNLREWHESAATHTYSFEAHGIPNADAVRGALADVIREVMIPGFAHVGLDVRALELWSRAGMPTR